MLNVFLCSRKLTQYSPSESAKVYEKTLNRRSNSLFDPKVTIQKLKEGALPKVLDEAAKRDIVNQYLNVCQVSLGSIVLCTYNKRLELQFKQLMLNFDPKDPDEEEEAAAAAAAATAAAAQQSPSATQQQLRVQTCRSAGATPAAASDAGTSANQGSVEQRVST